MASGRRHIAFFKYAPNVTSTFLDSILSYRYLTVTDSTCSVLVFIDLWSQSTRSPFTLRFYGVEIRPFIHCLSKIPAGP